MGAVTTRSVQASRSACCTLDAREHIGRQGAEAALELPDQHGAQGDDFALGSTSRHPPRFSPCDELLCGACHGFLLLLGDGFREAGQDDVGLDLMNVENVPQDEEEGTAPVFGRRQIAKERVPTRESAEESVGVAAVLETGHGDESGFGPRPAEELLVARGREIIDEGAKARDEVGHEGERVRVDVELDREQQI
ncbi:MAG: hypothetical protein R3B70_07300 [Polyangiaceae bacterium]